MEFYRYKDVCYANVGVKIQEIKFKLIKETPKGYWITYDWDHDNEYKKWVSKDGKKRYAYPTKGEALESFIHRKNCQIWILKRQLRRASSALSEGVMFHRKDKYDLTFFVSDNLEYITQEEMSL